MKAVRARVCRGLALNLAAYTIGDDDEREREVEVFVRVEAGAQDLLLDRAAQ